MKKILFVIIGLIVMNLATMAFANHEEKIQADIVETSVKINDLYLYSDTDHILVKDTVFVVGYALVEALGGTIAWNDETKTVTMLLDEHNISIKIGSKLATVDGKDVELYKAPFIKEGRTMIPLKFVSENFGYKVAWDQDTYTVDVVKEGLDVNEDHFYERSYTDEDLKVLSKIVTVESGDKSIEMALAIANTVINRVNDTRFPDSVASVVYQVDRYVQFPPAHKASFEDLEPSYLAIIAAKKALEGVNNIGDSLYFNNQPFKSKGDDLIRIIDGEYFYN